MTDDIRHMKMRHEEIYEAITADGAHNPLDFTVRTIDAGWIKTLAALEEAELEKLQLIQKERAIRLARTKEETYQDHGQSWGTEASLRKGEVNVN